MNYHLLGKLPDNVVDFFREEILKRKVPNLHYQWIHFDEFLHSKFLEIFENTELKVQSRENSYTKIIQKAFYSDPGHGFTIHKDGTKCKSALNIAISCNNDDWVRWYDEEYINNISSTISTNNLSKKYGISRNTHIVNYESVKFVDELRVKSGDVYVLNVDKFHSFKCNGVNPRIIIQTKFENFPELETIYQSLKVKNFSCIQNF